jgi:DNA polymerase-3 subunit gamma/tau
VSTALYRRYRPETFDDVIGQEHVTEPLMQALRTGRVNHAYLFSGPRGCGKTTSARILARCLNCEKGPTPEPCGECDSCVALARGGAGTVDVIEIDAASHGGVDDARDLRERASYGPAQSRYKVYIIDEAHMVTPQGFNALLKIVEEPPEHVKFVFATTEPEKVIGTIRSRTHHYPFRLVPPARLLAYLEDICASEGVAVAPGVLSFVVRAGGGSVRDSLSVLDQLIAGSGPEGLTYDAAAALLGFTDGELLDATVEAFAAGDAAAVFRSIDRVVETGLDPRRFVEDLLERLRDLIIVAAVGEGAAQVLRQLPEDQVQRMQHQAAAFGAGALSRAADVVNTGLTEMTGATAPRLQLELIAARVLLPGAAGEAGYAARLDRLERRVGVGGIPSQGGGGFAVGAPTSSAPSGPPTPAGAAPADPGTADSAAPAPDAPAAPAPAAEPPAPPVTAPSPPEPTTAAPAGGAVQKGPGGLDTDAVRRSWPDVLEWLSRHKRVTWTFVSQNAQVADYDGSRVLLTISTRGLADTFRRGPHAEYVRQALIDVLGVDARVEGVPADGAPPATGTPPAAPDGPPPTAPTDSGSGVGEAGSPDEPPGPPTARAEAVAGAPRPDPPSWSDAPPPPETAPAWGGSPERPGPPAPDGEEDTAHAGRVVDDSAVSDDDESIDEVDDVGVAVVERLLGGTVISEEER